MCEQHTPLGSSIYFVALMKYNYVNLKTMFVMHHDDNLKVKMRCFLCSLSIQCLLKKWLFKPYSVKILYGICVILTLYSSITFMVFKDNSNFFKI